MLLALSDVTYVLIGWFKFLLLKFLYEYGPWQDGRTSSEPSSRSLGTFSMYSWARSTLTICFSVSANELTTPPRRLVTDRAYEMARPTRPTTNWRDYVLHVTNMSLIQGSFKAWVCWIDLELCTNSLIDLSTKLHQPILSTFMININKYTRVNRAEMVLKDSDQRYAGNHGDPQHL